VAAEGRSGVPVSAQNLATVETPAAEFIELRKQRRSVLESCCVPPQDISEEAKSHTD